LAAVRGWQAEYLPRFGARFVYPTDEWFLLTQTPIPPKRYYDGLALQENGLGQVRDFLDEWRRSRRELKAHSPTHPITNSKSQPPSLKGRRATLATASLFAPTLAKAAREFDALAGSRLDVVPVLNERLGHTITVAGLLMGADVMRQLEGRELGEFVVLPRVMFDHPDGISLDDVPPLRIAQALSRPVFLADAMGDVLDAFTGGNLLGFDPMQPEAAPRPMKAGGWAVEKYL
jgi:NifB/MoaA-like Fe-S oxidoreductase